MAKRQEGTKVSNRTTAAERRKKQQAERDAVNDFIAEKCVTGKLEYRISAKVLWQKFSEWCDECHIQDAERPSKTRMGHILTSMGFDAYQRQAEWRRLGITLATLDALVK